LNSSDPLPWLFLGRQSELCHDTTFVDVDHPALMQNKMSIIEKTEQLRELLPKFTRTGAEQGLLASSVPYVAIGCDLIDVGPLQKVLQDHLQLSTEDAAIIFVSEVSTAYMEREDSQGVFRFAATYNDVRFVLLEQHLPDGADHPFAQTMLAHFDKLRTPLRAVGSMEQMKARFAIAGFPDSGIDIRSLWELWSDPTFLSAEQRRALDKVEPFDEWEEFALFGSHYFLLVAEKEPGKDYTQKATRGNRTSLFAGSGRRASIISSTTNGAESPQYHFGPEDTLQTHELLEPHNFRRFAAVLNPTTVDDQVDIVGLHGGLGTQERLGSCNTYTRLENTPAIEGPPLRNGLMCHAITSLGSTSNVVLTGGRTSPDKASAECWLRLDGKWKRVQNLPSGRYRHCAVPLVLPTQPRPAHTLLLFGGKTSEGHVLDEWLIWTGETGWQQIRVTGEVPPARFGACMITDSREGVSGVLVGGMTSAGRVLNDFWYWSLEGDMTLTCRNVTARATAFLKGDAFLLGRFGAQLVWSNRGILMIGGVTGSRMLTRQDEILNMKSLRPQPIHGPRPLFIGFSVLDVDGGLIVLGGGATCFSFGTTWNRSCMLNDALPGSLFQMEWRMLHITEAGQPTADQIAVFGDVPSSSNASKAAISTTGFAAPSTHGATSAIAPGLSNPLPDPVRVQEMPMSDGINFAQYVEAGRPVIFRKCDLGPCTTKWTTPYLKEAVGPERTVSVHVAADENMSFARKNFEYATQPWSSFLDAADNGEKVYLRALSHSHPLEKPTRFADDFPALSPDFTLPAPLAHVVDPEGRPAHSSPLRISGGGVRMWLHYDVMANLYCQVRGRKRLLLFPPSDVSLLDFAPGASSSDLDPSASAHPGLRGTHPHEARLEPGDILFLPPMWSHTSSHLPSSTSPSPATSPPPPSIALNIFFRNLPSSAYAAGKDVYGNRDLAAYARGRQDLTKIARAFDELPPAVAGFYLERLAAELEAKAKSLARNADLHSVFAELG
jgi:tRNA wybutosine-synthesizing protein 4